jgi:tetratricopeptide (TPR) repeat protein
MDKKLGFVILICITISILFSNTPLFSEQDKGDRKSTEKELKHKNYIEALVNLKSMEHYFTGEPIYLSKDEELKKSLKVRLQRIIEYIEEYYKIDNNNPEVLFFLGKSYSYAHDLDFSGAWQKSVSYLNKLIGFEPNNNTAHLIQGKNYMDDQQFEKAIEQYEEACKIEPYGQGLKFKGMAKIYLKRTDEAIKDLREYVKHNPKDEFAIKALNALESGQYSHNQ